MRVGPKIEPLLRQILDASVKQDGKRFTDNVKAFKTEEAAREGLDLAARICLVLLYQRYDGLPSSDQLDQLVETIAQSEAGWSSLQAGQFREALDAIVRNRPASGLAGDPGLAVAPFVLAAFLLAGMTTKPKWWFETLDDVLEQIERAL